MATTKKMIWSSEYDIKDYIEEFKKVNLISEEKYKEFEDVYVERLEHFAQYQVDLNLTSDFDNILMHEHKYGPKLYVVKASIGRWDGTYAGGKVIEGMANVINQCMEDSTDIYMEGKKMFIRGTHHDGVDFYEIKELTPSGETFYDNNCEDMADRELIEKLFNDSHKSKNVTIWRDMYGMK